MISYITLTKGSPTSTKNPYDASGHLTTDLCHRTEPRYGTLEMKQLLTHMKPVIPKDRHLQILSEYSNVKVYLRELSQTDNAPSIIYKSLLKKPNITNIRKLIELMLVISPSTAQCERGFSQMKLIKTELRNGLSDDSLRMLMAIKHHGPSLENFVADRAIDFWLGSGKRTRHVGGHSKHGVNY